MFRRLLLLPLLVVGLSLLPAPVRAEDGAEPVDLVTAHQDLARLEAAIKAGKSINEEITGGLDAVALAYHNPKAPAPPALQEVAADASEEQKAAIEAENEKLKAAYDVEKAKFDRELAKFRSDAEKAFIKALVLQKIHKRTETNTRDDVNTRAAQVLGETGNPDVAGDVVKALENQIFRAKYSVPILLLEACFAALGKLGNVETLAWMADNFTHTNNTPSEVDKLIAAHKGMILFPYAGVPGKLRYEIVDKMIITYSSTESQAAQNSTDKNVQAAKQFWDRIKNDAIAVVQHYANKPQNAEGEVYASMREFQDWFRDNKNQRKAPWIDEEPAEKPK